MSMTGLNYEFRWKRSRQVASDKMDAAADQAFATGDPVYALSDFDHSGEPVTLRILTGFGNIEVSSRDGKAYHFDKSLALTDYESRIGRVRKKG